jgi:phosphate transport system ATP-binding protein
MGQTDVNSHERLSPFQKALEQRASGSAYAVAAPPKVQARDLSFYYGAFRALKQISLDFYECRITALIGPSGCGKSTFLRTINRMNDLIPGARVAGELLVDGQDIYASDVDPVAVRRRIGMVFQRPNPFPMSVYDNIAYGPRLSGRKKKSYLDELVERSLRQAALWDEVQGHLKKSALALSGGQQQRLCIARAIALEPDVILMDEPASALDPIATLKIEELMSELSNRYTIIIVTHNMQQAARISDFTALFVQDEHRAGQIIEYGPTQELFSNPKNPRTEAYITGRFG